MATSARSQHDPVKIALGLGVAFALWKTYQTARVVADVAVGTVEVIEDGIEIGKQTVSDSAQGWKSAFTESDWERKLQPGQCNVVEGVRSCRNMDGTLTRTTDIKPWWEER